MRVWYDVCTGKHMRYGNALAKRLRSRGHEVVLTTREHPDTVGVADVVGEKPVVVGKYAPASLFSRLEASASRMMGFSKLFRNRLPDMAVAHQSVELCRTAFGLGVPITLTADTPHAVAVNKLTIPLANTLVISKAIPIHFFRRYGASHIVQFDGVDEVAWIKGFKPMKGFDFKQPLIVVRQMETRASYALGKEDVTLKLAEKLSQLGSVLFLSRYVKLERKGLIVVKGFVDSASAAAHADLVVSIGGTISREAALQGVPSIAVSEISRTYVNRFLARKGFPLFLVDSSKALECAKKYLGKRFDVEGKLAPLTNPIDVLEKVVTGKDNA
jgi:predicted glycosyltransferase